MKSTRFIWKIENFSCLKGCRLLSPSFSSHSETWEVKIEPSRNPDETCFNFGVHRIYSPSSLQHGVGEILYHSLAFLDSEGTPLVWREGQCHSVPFSIRKDKFRLLKEKLLPNDILTLECRIWQAKAVPEPRVPSWKRRNYVRHPFNRSFLIWPTSYDLTKVTSCFAHTRVEPLSELTEKTFTWNVVGVSSLVPNHIKEHEVSVTNRGDKLNMTLFVSDEEEIQVEITLPLVKTFSECKMSLLDATGKHIELLDAEFDFDTTRKKFQLRTGITTVMLQCNKDKFLPDDTLTLVFTFTFSNKVTFSCIVDENEIFFCNPQSSKNDLSLTSAKPQSDDNKNSTELQTSNSPNTISQVLQKMYEEGYMSDFSLRVEDRTFPVHKSILGTRSSVFNGMFTVDMKEKASCSVDIPDMDVDTVQRMLEFVYNDSVEEEMKWESASSLYAAADKYAIEPLKQRCSNILKSKLSGSSALGVLVLSVTYHDQDLEKAALEFIARNDKLIIGTESWCKFEENNPQIAIDALRKLYIKKMNE